MKINVKLVCSLFLFLFMMACASQKKESQPIDLDSVEKEILEIGHVQNREYFMLVKYNKGKQRDESQTVQLVAEEFYKHYRLDRSINITVREFKTKDNGVYRYEVFVRQ